jgi:hypothetical protein
LQLPGAIEIHDVTGVEARPSVRSTVVARLSGLSSLDVTLTLTLPSQVFPSLGVTIVNYIATLKVSRPGRIAV